MSHDAIEKLDRDLMVFSEKVALAANLQHGNRRPNFDTMKALEEIEQWVEWLKNEKQKLMAA